MYGTRLKLATNNIDNGFSKADILKAKKSSLRKRKNIQRNEEMINEIQHDLNDIHHDHHDQEDNNSEDIPLPPHMVARLPEHVRQEYERQHHHNLAGIRIRRKYTINKYLKGDPRLQPRRAEKYLNLFNSKGEAVYKFKGPFSNFSFLYLAKLPTYTYNNQSKRWGEKLKRLSFRSIGQKFKDFDTVQIWKHLNIAKKINNASMEKKYGYYRRKVERFPELMNQN